LPSRTSRPRRARARGGTPEHSDLPGRDNGSISQRRRGAHRRRCDLHVVLLRARRADPRQPVPTGAGGHVRESRRRAAPRLADRFPHARDVHSGLQLIAYRDFYYPLNVFMHILTREEGGVRYLHYGLFEQPDESIDAAQERSTELLLSRLPPPPARLLDVGVGLGTTLARLRELGYDAEGITPDAKQAAMARVPVTVASFEEYGAPSRRLDRRRPAAAEGAEDGARPAGEDAGAPFDVILFQ